MLKYLLASVIIFTAGSALAQHKHGAKGPNGGAMEDVAGVHAELVTSGKTITINVVDEGGKPVKTDGYSGTVLVTTGTNKETIKLEASGTSLKGNTKEDVAGNTQVTLQLKTSDGKSGQARFTR